MAAPEISCIIPTFNRAPLLTEAIRSITRQTFSNWELIIVDDGSTDNTESQVKSFTERDSRIMFYKNPRTGGSAARNFGISKALGEYVAFLDDDDISLPHRFESQLKAAKKSGNSFMVSGYQIRKRDTGKLISEQKLELKGNGSGFPSRWLINRKLLEKVGGFDESFPSMQDIELSYRLSKYETFALHDDIVAVLYHTENSVSTAKGNALTGKVMLMERLGSVMDPHEAAWWYFTIGTGFYSRGEKKTALSYYKKASEKVKSYNYKMGYLLATYSPFVNGIINKLNLKILKAIGDYKFPVLVNHLVVK